MEITNKNQNLYVLKASTIRHSDIQALPVIMAKTMKFINLSFYSFIRDFRSEGCLQVLDFISWAIFRNYEYKDSRFIELIKDKIVIKKGVFQKLSGP